jgi:hypothetical protein
MAENNRLAQTQMEMMSMSMVAMGKLISININLGSTESPFVILPYFPFSSQTAD